MPWKVDDDKHIVVDEAGNPVWIHEDGKEIGWNVPGQLASQNDLVQSKRKLKADLDSYKEQLKKMKEAVGEDLLEDPERITKALSTLADVEAGKLLESGKKNEAVQKALEDAAKEWKGKLTSIETQFEQTKKDLSAKEESIKNLLVRNAFATNAFLNKKTTMPADIATMLFGPRMKVEYDKQSGEPMLVPYKDDEIMYSMNPERPGKVATVDEAIERFFNDYPHRDQFLKDLPGGPRPFSGTPGTKDILLSGADARNAQLYQQAKQQAAKNGGKVILTD